MSEKSCQGGRSKRVRVTCIWKVCLSLYCDFWVFVLSHVACAFLSCPYHFRIRRSGLSRAAPLHFLALSNHCHFHVEWNPNENNMERTCKANNGNTKSKGRDREQEVKGTEISGERKETERHMAGQWQQHKRSLKQNGKEHGGMIQSCRLQRTLQREREPSGCTQIPSRFARFVS